MNVSKANWLVTGRHTMPAEKSVVNQKAIFYNQVSKYVVSFEMVAVLNSFPLFIYEYMKNSH